MRSMYWALTGCLTVMLWAGGCGSGSKAPTVPVQGKVTYQGQPVGIGTITFQPGKRATGTPFRPATGTLNPDGSYKLSTFSPGDGVLPGEYQVLIISLKSGPTDEQPDVPEVWAIPKQYGDASQSPLKVTVEAGSAPLEKNFDLR